MTKRSLPTCLDGIRGISFFWGAIPLDSLPYIPAFPWLNGFHQKRLAGPTLESSVNELGIQKSWLRGIKSRYRQTLRDQEDRSSGCTHLHTVQQLARCAGSETTALADYDNKMDPSIAGMQQYGTAVKEMLPKQICQAFFLIAASAVLFLNSIPAFRQRFISYGSRISSKPHTTSVNDSQPSKARETVIDKKSATSVVSQFLDYISTFQVPHSWFTHFYVLSVLSSIFWAVQVAIRGRFLELIVDGQAAHDDENEGIMTANQIFIAWLFMTIQGSRRLYESIVFGKPSKSRMWVVHWVLGLLYYAAMGVAIWIEGSGKYAQQEQVIIVMLTVAPQVH